MTVRPLAPAEKQQAGTQGSLVVVEVDGAAERAGVQPDDVVLRVAGAAVRTVAELTAAIKRSGRVVPLQIERDGRTIYVPVRAD
jgi:serine protease Do